jgi:HAD superfamily hydrolase (TIGR01509 family)
MVIFDCNGVLVDSEKIAAAVAAETLTAAGFPITAENVARHFFGRRPADMLAAMEQATGKTLPPGFGSVLAAATLKRLREELRPVPHAAHALSWLRGLKCVASSSPRDRIRISLDVTDLARYFEPNVFSASDVAHGKPAPDLFLHAAANMNVLPADCIVIEDSPAGVAAASAAGMTPIGFLGGSHADPDLAEQLTAAGARMLITDMRHLKGTIVALRGW